MASRGLSPADLDPLEAASAPITPDPRMKPKKWGQRQIDAHVRGTMDAAYDNDEAHSVLIAQLVEQGYPPAEAAKIAARDMARAQIDSFRTPKAQPSAPAPVPEDMIPRSPEELRGMGLNPYTEPGANMPDGTPAKRPEPLANERSARVYNERIPYSPEMNGQVPSDAAFAPSLRDKAMAARGFYPVYRPDGTVGYSTGVGYQEAGGPTHSRDVSRGSAIPGGLGRNGPRADLEPGFDLVPERGPNGTVYVYRQNAESKAKQAAYDDRQQVTRIARSTGLDENDLAGMTPEERTKALSRARSQDQNNRMATWKAQAMLAGGRPTGGIGGSKAAVNAFHQLNDPNTNDWQKAVMANALRPDMDNTTPLTVDAMGAQNAMRLLNATNLGANGFGGAGAAATQMYSDKRRADAVAKAEELSRKYGNRHGEVTPAVKRRIRDRIEAEFPGHGDAAVGALPEDEPLPLPPGHGDFGRVPDGHG